MQDWYTARMHSARLLKQGLSVDEIEKQIVDQALFKQIEKQVRQVGSLKESFENGIYMLDRKGNKVNKIRHIRIFKSITEPLEIKKQTYLSKFDYKRFYYASNASNIAYGLYKTESGDKIDFKILNLFQAAKTNSYQEGNKINLDKEITNKKHSLILYAMLRPSQKGIFFKNSILELKDLSVDELSKRMYKIDGFEKDGRIRFTHHLSSMSDKELKDLESTFGKGIYQGFSTINFEKPWPKLKLSMGNLKMAIEGMDFTIKMDGSIAWIK